MTNLRIPSPIHASYKAAVLIRDVGPLSRATLFAQVHFSHNPSHCTRALDLAIDSGWLDDVRGEIILGITAQQHFKELDRAAAPYVGQVAGPRDTTSVYDRPALSKRFIPNSRGTRADVPEYSLREAPRYRSLAGSAT